MLGHVRRLSAAAIDTAQGTAAGGSSVSALAVGALESKASSRKRMLRVQFLVTIGSVTGYVALGAYFFYVHEEAWSYTDAVYFSVVTISTCGFGDLLPSSSATKAFNAIFALVGVTVVFGQLTALIQAVQAMGVHMIQLQFAKDASDLPSSPARLAQPPQSAFRFYFPRLAGWVFLYVFIQCGCAMPYWLLSLDPTFSMTTDAALKAVAAKATFPGLVAGGVPYGEALYFGWITAWCVCTRVRSVCRGATESVEYMAPSGSRVQSTPAG